MRPDEGRRFGWLNHERRVFVLSLVAGLPAVIASLVLLRLGDYSTKVTWTVGTVIVGTWLIVSLVVRERVVRPLQTLSNMLAALREGDFSLRARSSLSDDALALALLEVNTRSEERRVGKECRSGWSPYPQKKKNIVI